jgi:cytochrome c oxidase subunit 2
MKKFLYIFLTYFISSNAFANQPKDWQLGFQEAAFFNNERYSQFS